MILNGQKNTTTFIHLSLIIKFILNKLFFFYIFVYFNFRDCKQYEYIFMLYIIYVYNT